MGFLVPYLVKITRACLVTGYVPATRRQIRVVFIPRPSRNSYGGPKDFRPINLISFLLKTMESLVGRFLRDKILAFVPLHPNKRSHYAGNGLHQLVLWDEKALDQQETALGVSLDKEGAFKNIYYGSTCVALAKRWG